MSGKVFVEEITKWGIWKTHFLYLFHEKCQKKFLWKTSKINERVNKIDGFYTWLFLCKITVRWANVLCIWLQHSRKGLKTNFVSGSTWAQFSFSLGVTKHWLLKCTLSVAYFPKISYMNFIKTLTILHVIWVFAGCTWPKVLFDSAFRYHPTWNGAAELHIVRS